MASVLIVRKSALPSLPENVREYVAEFFAERTVLGVECLVAERHTHHPRGSSYNRWDKGMAPSHSVDLMCYGESGGLAVGDAIRNAVKETPEDIVELFCTDISYNSMSFD
jgi:hypothetical protein